MQKLAYSVEYHLFIIFIRFYFLLFFVPRDDDLIEAVEMDMDDNANDVDRDQKIVGHRATCSFTPTLTGRLIFYFSHLARISLDYNTRST